LAQAINSIALCYLTRCYLVTSAPTRLLGARARGKFEKLELIAADNGRGAPRSRKSYRFTGSSVVHVFRPVIRPDIARAYDELVGHLGTLDRGELGPQIGEPMQAFSLPDENGCLVSLTSLLQSGPAVISFNRGHWCPYCKLELRSLAAILGQIRQLGARVVSIMPDIAGLQETE
jgi:AhpC/TSA family